MSNRQFVANSFFLCEHKAISEFATHIASKQEQNPHYQFSVVCERKEDLKAVRAQLYFELGKLNPALYGNVVGGIAMYTLDNLAQTFVANLANSNPDVLGQTYYQVFRKPFLDVVTQEQLLRFVLIQFGYLNSDALPIAKQLLTLIDAPWPHDFTFLDLMAETQSSENTRTVHEITEISLRQIVATFHVGQKIFQNFSRLQPFVLNYLESEFLSHCELSFNGESGLVLPDRIVHSDMLWVAAPEYSYATEKSETSYKHRPGNFQASVVDIFRSKLASAVGLNPSQQFWHAETKIEEQVEKSTHTSEFQVNYQIFANQLHFFGELKTELERAIDVNEKRHFYLLADFDPGMIREVYADASGSYPFSDLEISAYSDVQIVPSEDEGDTKNSVEQLIIDSIQSFREEITLLSRLTQPFLESMREVGRRYNLRDEPFSMQYLLQKIYGSEQLNYGDRHPISRLDRALSFIAIDSKPRHIRVVGRPHSHTAPSFNVKILNDAIYLLRRRGIEIDVLASDISYTGFWTWLTQGSTEVTFLLNRVSDLEEFPEHLKPKGAAQLQIVGKTTRFFLDSSLNSSMSEALEFKVPNWTRLYDWPMGNKNCPKVAVTQFEDYIHCPLSFFLKHVSCLQERKSDFGSGEHLEIGIRAHKICENFLSRVTNAFQGKPLARALPLFKSLQSKLRDQDFFLSNDVDRWISTLRAVVQSVDISAFAKQTLEHGILEACDTLFLTNRDLEPLTNKINREYLKRIFLRLIETEIKCLESNSECRIAFLEHPISFSLGGLHISGRIDRIDSDGKTLKIYDYKSSKVPKSGNKLFLLPKQTTANQSALSVQAALYTYGLVQRENVELDSEEIASQPIHSFSLYRLKTLDEKLDSLLTYAFPVPLKQGSQGLQEIFETYENFAKLLAQGDFSPKPLSALTCERCQFARVCPLIRSKQGEVE